MKTLSLIITSAALIFAATNAIASTNKNVYYLKGEAITGSLIPTIDAKSNIPFNKSYEDLNQTQKTQVRAQFKNLGSNDTPPYPIHGLGAVYEPLIKANKVFGLNKTIKLEAMINRTGLVSGVNVLSKSDINYTNYLQKALNDIKFKPAQCGSVSCEMNFPIEIAFN